eukprot:Ihof_evm4s304 gene=Ihof_evmTU4s304
MVPIPTARSMFRPCIDLHNGQVKQIVGGTLTAQDTTLQTNFVAKEDAAYYAGLYRRHGLRGGHIIKLGPGNDAAAKAALQVWPQGMHIGGGITYENALYWLDQGAEKVIVTSWLFPDGHFSLVRLQELSDLVGPHRLVIDLSCRQKGDTWFVVIDRWQTITTLAITEATLHSLGQWCSEFLIHAADIEGLCKGIDQRLVEVLGRWSSKPCVYAGGANSLSDLALVDRLSNGRVDLTYG